MPRINAILLIGVLLLVGLFRSSGALAGAYGIAVTGTMVVTAMLAFIVVWRAWNWHPCGRGGAGRPVPSDRPHLPLGQPPEDRLRAAGSRSLLGGFLMVVMLTWRRGSRHPLRKDAAARSAAGRAWSANLEKPPAAAHRRHRRLPHRRPGQHADGASPQPQALSRCCTRTTSSSRWSAPTRRGSIPTKDG